MDNERDRRTTPRHTREIAWGVLLPAAALGWGVGTWLVGRYDDVRRELSTHAICCESFRSYQTEDSGQRHFWVGVIEQLRSAEQDSANRITAVETAIEQLRRVPSARPDPFTGTDGERLRARIEQLERRLGDE